MSRTRAVILAMLVFVLASAPAGAQSQRDPSELWKAFPLDPAPKPRAAPGAAAPADTAAPAATATAGRAEPQRPPIAAKGDRTTPTIGALIAFAAGVGALAVALLRRRAGGRAPADGGAQREPRPAAPSKPSERAETPIPAEPFAPRPTLWARRFHRGAVHDGTPAERVFDRRAPEPNGSQAPATTADAAAKAAQVCRIQLWHAYIRKQFYAAPVGGGRWLAESDFFQLAAGESVADSADALGAVDGLVAELRDAGWEIARRGEQPWELELIRTRAPLARRGAQHRPS
jgi:hypothetical protein